MNKRNTILELVSGRPPETLPAAFFLHFDPQFQQGQAAIDKHLEFFRYTGMDLVKIQYEQSVPDAPAINTAADWTKVPSIGEEHFAPTVQVVEGLVKAAREEAVVILTIYSPFMWAMQLGGLLDLGPHLQENPQAVKKGLEILTENVRTLVRACKRVGVDGFYVSTQGGETFRKGGDTFEKTIKPTDLAVWEEIGDCPFNILHVCDYVSGYDDYTPFLDYPGQVVNCSLKLGERELTPKQAAEMFKRPFMGGLERKGVIAAGSPQEIRREVTEVLEHAPERFILGADCTVPSETTWDNLKIAIEAAHQSRR